MGTDPIFLRSFATAFAFIMLGACSAFCSDKCATDDPPWHRAADSNELLVVVSEALPAAPQPQYTVFEGRSSDQERMRSIVSRLQTFNGRWYVLGPHTAPVFPNRIEFLQTGQTVLRIGLGNRGASAEWENARIYPLIK